MIRKVADSEKIEWNERHDLGLSGDAIIAAFDDAATLWETCRHGWRCSFPETSASRSRPITTRRDVLKWLDVLGIDPATKGGAT